VFDLERRIYSVDRMRLNPSGVPLRGVVYLLCTIGCAVFAARLPVLGAPFLAVPWLVRDVIAPAAVAAALTVIRVDGRAFHQAARSMARYLTSRRRTVALGAPSPVGRRWRPDDLLLLPDGADTDVRRFLYRGPGAVLILVAHRAENHRRAPSPRACPDLRLTARRDARRLARARVLGVESGARLLVAADRRDQAR
jgi:hypothetical protein